MAAATTDLLQEVGLPGSATNLSSPGYTDGDTSITVGSTSNWPTATGVTFAIDRAEIVDGREQRIEGTYCEFVGVVSSGTSVTSVSRVFGIAQDYPADPLTRVYIPVSSERENRIVEWGTQEHNQDGTHGAITSDSINTGNLTFTGTYSGPDGAIGAADLSTSAISQAYVEVADASYNTTTNDTLIPGATLTFTNPAGGRRIELLFSTASAGAGANIAVFKIWKGTVGSGTVIVQYNQPANNNSGIVIVGYDTPAAGSVTYNVSYSTSNTATSVSIAKGNGKNYLTAKAI